MMASPAHAVVQLLMLAEHDIVGVGVFRDLEHRIFAGARPIAVRGRVAYWSACNSPAFPSNGDSFSARTLTKCQTAHVPTLRMRNGCCPQHPPLWHTVGSVP
ncbi:hypothetical protein BJ970_006693 [Saccharopolyspora phatthalungensis]|uniref:Uncharacterized protein n=1 Tax=Saccharopolyspora phatthalungensis TaxID=664693 RepID=A0A840QE70_9PSEU|nr:hypothetical protein [Saccharopolyspora phatthalungensis]